MLRRAPAGALPNCFHRLVFIHNKINTMKNITKRIQNTKLFLMLSIRVQNRKLRKLLRKKGFLIYTSKRKAKIKASRLARKFKIVYWVMDEVIGYYVIHKEQVHQLNVNEMKRKGATKIRVRDLNENCVWRSKKYSNL